MIVDTALRSVRLLVVRCESEWLERVRRAAWLFKKFQHRSFR